MPSPSAGRAQRDHGFAGVHRAAHGELETGVLVVELVDGREDAQRRAHSPLGVVLVRNRCAEDGHHRVPDELLDRSAETLNLQFHARVVRPQARTDILGIGLLGSRGEADQVDEQDRDDLSLLRPRPRGLVDRGTAGPAESCPLRVLFTALGTCRHPQSLRRREGGA
jgi:hypothetical protein